LYEYDILFVLAGVENCEDLSGTQVLYLEDIQRGPCYLQSSYLTSPPFLSPVSLHRQTVPATPREKRLIERYKKAAVIAVERMTLS
jgi:hypothetical protein